MIVLFQKLMIDMAQNRVLFYTVSLSRILLLNYAITRKKGGAVMSSAVFMHQGLGLHLASCS
jgi:hypothetical protein